MKSITKYINEGFFNNVGANYKDIILDWLLGLDGIIEQYGKEEITLRRISKKQLSSIVDIDNNGNIITHPSKRSTATIWTKIYPKDIDSMPDVLYFGDNLTLKLIFCDFSKSDFSKLDRLKGRLSLDIAAIEFNGCDVPNMEFLKGVKYITSLRMYESSVKSFNGISEVKIDFIHTDHMRNTDGGNVFSTLPKISGSIFITDCNDIKDLTYIKDSLTPTTKLNIYRCNNITKCDLSGLTLNKISGDDSIFHIFGNPDMFPKKLKTIEFDTVKDLQRLDKIKDMIKNHYPPSVDIYCIRCRR